MSLITIRASSLPELFDCGYRWYARNVLKMRMPTSGVALLGTAIHAGTAAFDAAKLEGNPITADEAAGAVVDAIWKPWGDVDWGEQTQKEAEKIGIALHGKYCASVAPKMRYEAVEARCKRLDITDIGLSFTGTTDRVYRDKSDRLGIADLKTGKNAVSPDGTVKTGKHRAQVAIYELLVGMSIGEELNAPALIIGMSTAKTESAQRVAIGEINRGNDILIGDEENPGILRMASKIIKSGAFYGNPQSMVCNVKYCPAYRICKWK